MAAAMAAECVVLVVVRTVVVVCVVVCEQHLVCELGGQVSEARVVRTFLANDAAYLTLLGAVTQLRRSEIVSLGVGLPVVVLCGVFNESWVSADCPFLRIKTQHIIPSEGSIFRKRVARLDLSAFDDELLCPCHHNDRAGRQLAVVAASRRAARVAVRA